MNELHWKVYEGDKVDVPGVARYGSHQPHASRLEWTLMGKELWL